MAPRDPAKTARNRQISELDDEIAALTPRVLALTGFTSTQSLNATYGGKNAIYIDIKNEVIESAEQFIALYLQGFLRTLEALGDQASEGNPYFDAHTHVKKHDEVQAWLKKFLSRTFLKNYDALSKKRPLVEEAELWIGQNSASYGILVTPRFRNGAWENDKSEIRHFRPNYWTIGHILETGFVVPDDEDRIEFADTDAYLSFFRSTLVRNSGSVHERQIAKRYCEFVQNASAPEDVPLLIPELRYGGRDAKHKHRLDFAIVDPHSLSKVGFELSPWSTHGAISGTKSKSQAQINEEARRNFEKEMAKVKSYFRKMHIPVLIYTDTDLADYDKIFEDISTHLTPSKRAKQLEFHAMDEFLRFGNST